ncbi:hypothetical protein V8E36_008484 [Tilletia maclaganii]
MASPPSPAEQIPLRVPPKNRPADAAAIVNAVLEAYTDVFARLPPSTFFVDVKGEGHSAQIRTPEIGILRWAGFKSQRHPPLWFRLEYKIQYDARSVARVALAHFPPPVELEETRLFIKLKPPRTGAPLAPARIHKMGTADSGSDVDEDGDKSKTSLRRLFPPPSSAPSISRLIASSQLTRKSQMSADDRAVYYAYMRLFLSGDVTMELAVDTAELLEQIHRLTEANERFDRMFRSQLVHKAKGNLKHLQLLRSPSYSYCLSKFFK